MIKIENINKYYNKNNKKKNHIIKNVSLNFGNKGLVVILGKSGSGKTSLLNVISGMDTFDSGVITFDGTRIKKNKRKLWNKIRNEKIGYIFQNNNLFHNSTVEDNIAITLKMIGISNPEEIRLRVNYLLETVGLKNYNNRLAKSLSGGQQQRVSFARAIVKNPKVIIADEPTGNVDSKTTLELMNVLKKLSKEKLVIMVTHERDLAAIYADRIIEIDNGSIVNDYENTLSNNTHIIEEQKIYLKDMKKYEANSNHISVREYSDEKSDDTENVDLDVIKRNSTYYLKVNTEKYKRIKVVNNESEIELIDDYSSNHKQDLNTSFNFESIITTPNSSRSSVITFKDAMRRSIRKLYDISYSSILFLLVLALVGASLSISIGLIGKYNHIEDKSIINKPKNFITVAVDGKSTFQDVFNFKKYEFVKDISIIKNVETFTLNTNKYYEIKNPIEFEAFPVNIDLLNESELLYGIYPENGNYGIVVDKIVADYLIDNYKVRGIESYKDILTYSLKIHSSGNEKDFNEQSSINFEIVGIADNGSPSIWMDEGLIYSLIMPNIIEDKVLGEGVVITEGEYPTINHGILIHEENMFVRNGRIPNSVGSSHGDLQVSGSYKYIVDNKSFNTEHLFVSSIDIIRRVYFDKKYRTSNTDMEFLVYADDYESAIESFKEMGIKAYSKYLDDYNIVVASEKVKNISFYLFALVGFFVTGISILFIMRSNLISRIYEVSVYRALGVPNNDVRKLFFTEIITNTTISSVIGYFLMAFILVKAQNNFIDYAKIVRYDLVSITVGVLTIYLVNIVFGLLPVSLLLLKSPAQIFKKYDL